MEKSPAWARRLVTICPLWDLGLLNLSSKAEHRSQGAPEKQLWRQRARKPPGIQVKVLIDITIKDYYHKLFIACYGKLSGRISSALSVGAGTRRVPRELLRAQL